MGLLNVLGGLTPPDNLRVNNNGVDIGVVGYIILAVVISVMLLIIIYAILKSREDKEIDEIYDEIEIDEESESLLSVTEKETVIEKKELTDDDVENLKRYKTLLENGIISQDEYDKVKNQTLNIFIQDKKIAMKCPDCGSENCQIINEVATAGKDYDAKEGCCGYICFGPIGLLCGACGKGKKTTNTNYWVCNNCGKKWRV